MTMKYRINFWDKDFKIVTQEQGEKLMEFIKEAKPTEPIFLEDEMYIRSQIVNIKRAIPGEDYDRETVEITEPSRRIEGKRCQGRHSIQLAIMSIIRNKYGSDWPKMVQDRKLREEIRQTLLTTGKDYCDYKTGSCYCYSRKGGEVSNADFLNMVAEVTGQRKDLN